MVKDVFYQLSLVPRTWWIPRRDRAILAVIGVVFWSATIHHALSYSVAKASVFSLFGLGLLYVVFSLCNLAGGIKVALDQHAEGTVHESHPRMLIELFGVLLGMFLGNLIALLIYVFKGASLTAVDTASLGLDSALILCLIVFYGYGEFFKHPIARGWLAIAGKTIPQIVTATLFIVQPHTASSLALITLFGIDVLSALRLFPTLKAYLHNKHNQHLGGLLLGETGNMASGLLLTIAWFIAQTLHHQS